MQQDFPGGPLVENLPAYVGDMGPIPGMGRFHMPQGSSARGPQAHVPRAGAPQQEKPRWWETLHTAKSSPHFLQIEKACAQIDDPAQPLIS